MDLLIAEAVQNIVMCSLVLLLHAATAPVFIGFGPHWDVQVLTGTGQKVEVSELGLSKGR